MVGSDITAMYLAARAGHGKIVKILIKGGANINVTKSYGLHKGSIKRLLFLSVMKKLL